jgi:hypothetical protein
MAAVTEGNVKQPTFERICVSANERAIILSDFRRRGKVQSHKLPVRNGRTNHNGNFPSTAKNRQSLRSSDCFMRTKL